MARRLMFNLKMLLSSPSSSFIHTLTWSPSPVAFFGSRSIFRSLTPKTDLALDFDKFGRRTLYSDAALGIDGFLQTRKLIQQRFGSQKST